MFVSYKWLEEYVDLDGILPRISPKKSREAELKWKASNIREKELKALSLDMSLEREQHPNADKLNKCLVDIGEEEPVQIICGAPNVDKGQNVLSPRLAQSFPAILKLKRQSCAAKSRMA